ncbi:MAG: hypothetical protein MJZ05_11585 [Fibrobacter sp.]|nr:hypothetical protein [Fibrobacter sp.]
MKKIFALTFAAAMACATSAIAAESTCTDAEKNYGPITIKKDGNGRCVAIIDADGDHRNDPVVIEEPEVVDSIYYFRSNSASGTNQTIVLPFDVPSGCFFDSETDFYNITKIGQDSQTKNWRALLGKAISVKSEGLEANKPYVIRFKNPENSNTPRHFRLGSNNGKCQFTFSTVNGADTSLIPADTSTGLSEGWTLKGVYSKKTWADAASRKGVYGFAGTTNGASVGEFKKAGENASVPSLRAYLVYGNNTKALAKSAAATLSSNEELDVLPMSMEVLVEGECFTEGDGIFEVKMVNGKKTACIDGQSDARLQTLSIPEDVEVDSVVYNRKFKQGVLSTVMFPFGGKIHSVFYGAGFFRIADVQYVYGEWTVLAWQVGESAGESLVANTPYIINPYEASQLIDGEYLPFCVGIANSCATLNTTTGNKTTTIGSWSLRGTYEKLEYGNAPFTGSAYGFAVDGNSSGVVAGKFVKAKTGASVPPMRAYLKYVGPALKTMANASIEEDFPETLRLMLLTSDGNPMGLGRMNTLTGEIKMDDNAWFDMKGRKMNHKPTVKGTYYNKGQKVIIK